KTSDEGQTWQPLSVGPIPSGTWFDNVALDGSNVYLGGSYRLGLYESRDAGRSWAQAGLSDFVYQVVSTGGAVYAATGNGVRQRKANRTSWSALGPALVARSLVLDPQQSGAVLAGTYHRGEGILRVSETGVVDRNQGLTNRSCYAMALVASGGET